MKLRSSARLASTPPAKRPLHSDQETVESSKANKRTKKKAPSRSNQPLTGEGVVLPSRERLNIAFQTSNYHRALLLKRNQDDELLKLDQSLSVSFSKSKNESTKTRLERVLRWKLLRGQYRATLPGLVAQNSSEEVDRVVHKALDQLQSCETVDQALQSNALSTMCELKGVGPATAAAFLSFEFPNLIPVFSDEAASFFEKELGSIKYTLPFYKKFATVIQLKTQELGDISWHVNRLERALWTIKILKNELEQGTTSQDPT